MKESLKSKASTGGLLSLKRRKKIMGKLRDDYVLWSKRKSAADLVQTVEDMLQQETNTMADAVALKAQIKTDVGNDVFNKADFIAAGRALEILANITQKKASYRAELQTLKPLMQDVEYETEIQTAIDLL